MTEATPDLPLRWCGGCRTDVPSDAFQKAAHRCRECVRLQNRRRRAIDYDTEMERQDGKCAICRKPPVRRGQRCRLSVDHDHKTGHFRGLICDPCNLMLGLAEDDPVRLLAAIEYLKRPGRPLDLPSMYRRPRLPRYPVTVSYQEPSPPEPWVLPTPSLRVQATHQSGSR